MSKFHHEKSIRIPNICLVILTLFISLLHVTVSVAQYYYNSYGYVPYVPQPKPYFYTQPHPVISVGYPQIVPFYIPKDTDSSASESLESGERTEKPGLQGSNASEEASDGNITSAQGSNVNQTSAQGSKAKPRLILEGRASSTYIKYLVFDRQCKGYIDFPAGLLTNCWMELSRTPGLEKLVWQVGKPTKVLIHGFSPKSWQESDDIIEAQGLFSMAEEFKSDTNVIIVDWTVYAADTIYYPTAAANTFYAGKQVADFLALLQRRNNWSYADYFEKMHIIGFSLGAHVAGVAGRVFFNDYSLLVGRITGKDFEDLI